MLRHEVKLLGVHADLVRVVHRAAELLEAKKGALDLVVLEGLRTLERQRQLRAAGLSQVTTTGRHLTGHAVDLGAFLPFEDLDGDGRDDDGLEGLRWDWPLYAKVAAAVKAAARELGVAIVWGGDWKMRDGPHFELDRKVYPAIFKA